MAMTDATEDEARATLAIPSVCPNAEPWNPQPRGGIGFQCGAGLLDADGSPRGLAVDLLVSQARATKLMRFKFTVFKSTQWGPERLYQLDVQCFPRLPSDSHQYPHEHFGRYRSSPQEAWAKWTFDDVLTRFRESTNITFEPRVTNPFELDFNLR
jgi:hypothetical protein